MALLFCVCELPSEMLWHKGINQLYVLFCQTSWKAMDKKQLTEADIISKFILPAIDSAGWDSMTQIRQEVKLRDGKVIVRGQIGIRKNPFMKKQCHKKIK